MRVLFVCVHNAGRSQMAEALTNRLAHEAGLDVKAESAGTNLGHSLNPMAVKAMRELDIEMTHQKPKLLTAEMINASDRIISMGCGVNAEACPANFILTEDWGLDDPAGQSLEQVRRIRDQIAERVKKMLQEIA